MSITTVIFDLGGVLIDWNPRYLYRKLMTDDSAIEVFLSEVCTQDWNEQQDAGRTVAEATALLVAEHPHHRDLIEAYYDRFDEMMAGDIPGTVAVLESIKAAGQHQLLALTNFSHETFPIAQRRFPFLDHFEEILVSGEVGLKKPDPAIFQMLMDRHPFAPEQAVFIDDVAHNVEAASALGLNTVHFRNADQLREELTALLD